ncbi:TonB-dependent receptor domain-containing protein [Maricaulis parjimensis]|uniref:TonB-dependent receptor domain-containing protein n=1 Tax=Maricaulis parjimensis TaxID=144023 RepID=UPI001939A751
MDSQTGIAVYAPGFFSNYSPVTALDMVARIPGFSLSNGDTNRRGLGDSFGNLLINGARPSNKSLTLQTVLQRIPMEDVAQIELIQEALPQYNMRGHARLVNVILREGAGRSGAWTGNLTLSDSGRLGTRHQLSYSFPVSNADVTLGVDAGFSGNRMRRREERYDANGDQEYFSRDSDQRRYTEIIPTLSVNWTLDERSSLRLDAQGQYWDWHRNRANYGFEPNGDPLFIELNETMNYGTSGSGTITYSRELGEHLSSETILLASRGRWEEGPEPYALYDAQTGFVGATIVVSETKDEETALRQTFNWNRIANHNLEFGAETAVNARDTTVNLFQDDGVTVTPIVLPVTSTRVEETRSELFANHVWQVNDRLSIESGLRYEISEIEQTGDAEQSRSFTYPKPSITVNWRQDDDNRFRFTARRDVAQLQFDKFASSVDIQDNNSTLGNPDYVPQRTWTLEAEWEHRFGEDGSASLQIGYDMVEDLDGWVPVTTPGGVFDAPGNIGDGTNLRITGNLTTPLDRFGLSNAVLDVFLEWYNTNVEDPLTGEDRVWSGPREWELALDFRQTFPQSGYAWGWDYHWVSNGEVYRAQRFQVFDNTDGDLDIYAETTNWFGMTIRAGVDGVFNNGDDRTRTLYNGSRANGVIFATEHRNVSMGQTVYLRVVDTF